MAEKIWSSLEKKTEFSGSIPEGEDEFGEH